LLDVHVPPVSSNIRQEAIRNVQEEYLSAGITRVIEPGLREYEIRDYLEIAHRDELKVRGTALGLIENVSSPTEDAAGSGYLVKHVSVDKDWFGFGGYKVYLDGGGSLGTALLREHYPGKPGYCGEQLIGMWELGELIAHGTRINRPVGVHAVGGKAIDI